MSCLGERLTALVDGELGHEERESALAHLAACTRCRAEADGLRQVKGRLRGLAEVPPSDGADDLPAPDFLNRLRSLGDAAEIGEPTQPTRPIRSANRPARPAPPSRPRDNRPAARAAAVHAAAPGPSGPSAAPGRPPRRRYLAVGAATLFIGLSTASYVAGGERETPSVTPAFDRFAVEHALTSGDAPLTDPLTDPGAQTPAQTPPEP